MSRWPRVHLEDVATIDRDGIEPSSIRDGSMYVGLENIESGGRLINVSRVSNGDLASTKFRFGRNHLLYGKLRPYLAKIALPTFEGVCSTDILPVMPTARLDRTYLAYFLRQPRMIAYASSRSEGINLPRLSPSALAGFEIPLPPLAEQRQIAGILDQADELRQKRRSSLDRLEKLSQSIFAEMFGDPAGNPKVWPRVKLGDLIASGPQNGLYKPSSDYGSGTPILRIDAFYDGEVTKSGSLKRLRISKEDRDLYGLKQDDIVVNRVNSMEYLGKSALIPELSELTVFESNMMRFSLDRERADPVYIIQFLQSSFIKSQICSSAKNAVNQSSINQRDVTGFFINVPPISVQTIFRQRHDSIRRLRARTLVSRDKLDLLFASLRHRAFSGELTSKDAERELAMAG